MKMNRMTMMGALAALALMMAPSFTAQAADISPDVNVNAPATAGDIDTPDTEVEDDVAEVETVEVEAPEVEAPEVEAPEVETPEVETPELGD